MAELFLILILPALIIFLILFACKHYNFSLFPRGMKGRKPKPWKFPKVKRDSYRWDSYSSSSDDETSDGETSSGEESSSSDDNIRRQIKTAGSFYGSMTPGGRRDVHPRTISRPAEPIRDVVTGRTPSFYETNHPIQNEKVERGRAKRASSRVKKESGVSKEQEVVDRLASHIAPNPPMGQRGQRGQRGRGRGGTTRGSRKTGNRRIGVYDPDLMDPTKEVRYIDEREYDSMIGADNPNE